MLFSFFLKLFVFFVERLKIKLIKTKHLQLSELFFVFQKQPTKIYLLCLTIKKELEFFNNFISSIKKKLLCKLMIYFQNQLPNKQTNNPYSKAHTHTLLVLYININTQCFCVCMFVTNDFCFIAPLLLFFIVFFVFLKLFKSFKLFEKKNFFCYFCCVV